VARGILWLGARLSLERALALGRFLGRLAHRLARGPRRVARENIRRTIGADLSPEEIDGIVRDCFEHLGLCLMEFVALGAHREELMGRHDAEGVEHLERVVAEGRGGVLVSGHLGNWELHGAFFAGRGFPVHAMYKRLANPWIDRLVYDQRRASGMTPLSNKEWRERIEEIFARGEILGMVSDQDAGKRGIFVEFLGRAASTFVGPAVISLRHGVPLIPTYMVRRPDGRYFVKVLPPLTIERTGDLEQDVAALTREWVRVLEEAVRRTPGQYFWFHRRWKTRPPERTGA
jgi:KDO2-lipid IV(A) lauroyltransferase